jgi:hypothetical protein
MHEVNIDYKLGVIESKLDMLLAQESAKDERMTAQEARIQTLENFRWKLAGALSAWMVVLSIALAWYEHAR